MSPAKLGVQIAHGTIESYRHSNLLIRDPWYFEGMKKIVLMVKNLDDLNKFKNKAEASGFKPISIVDFGLTEIEPNTITGLAFPISEVEAIDKITKRLQLYR